MESMVSRAATQANPSTVVIDNGTGYTKMGYAGNLEPSYLIPSCIAKAVVKVSLPADLVYEWDFARFGH